MKVSAGYLERVARDWQKAFEAAHNKPAPPIVWERGWFRVDQGTYKPRYRRAKVEEMTKVLRRGFTD